MVNIHLSAEDLARVRFAFSTLWEAVASYRALRRPEKYPLHLPWIREAREALAGADLGPLEALVMMGGYPDFLTPPPTTPLPDFAAEVEHLLQTPHELVAQDIRNVLESWPQAVTPAVREGFEPYLRDPRGSLERLADTLHFYWERTLAHHWPRLRILLEADVMYRARIFALEGPEKLFNELHPALRYQNRTLQIVKHGWDAEIDLSGRGLLLIPSVFADHTLMFEPPWQETLQYGARGTAGLWCPEPPPAAEALEKLLGHNRARLLKYLVTPSTTRELAYLFDVSPSAISQHLGWLRETGLVATQRHGKNVFYKLSPIGESLLEAYGELETPLALVI
ncbi:ArsR/SmtB family transcription factor [Calidithermus chliarophilus]|uniref:ArsR/SmtB family transcription factor n=1 Tax=Calidithermus chliarophilus TaxID=52023 RepID=UPI0003F8560A|nr:ArsR family transcriptional regulator [Calidithermus chliarophilus]